MYAFIGAGPAPGVAEACFTGERERFGPADHKIWATSQISGDSVGRGESVPAGLIAPAVTTAINELVAALGYRPVDEDWGTPGRAADPRLPDTIRSPAGLPGGGPAPGSEALEQSLRSRLDAAGERFPGQWQACAAEKFLIVSRTASGGNETQWLVDATARTITIENEADDDGTDGDDGVTWSILGSPQAWQAVLTGQLNLQAALRHNDLRYCPAGTDGLVTSQNRIAMLADLLGPGAWAQTDAARPDTVAVS